MPALWGVNVCGAEFGPTGAPGVLNHDYLYPADPERAAYFVSRRLTLARVPVTWERLQHEAYGPLSQPDVAGVLSVLDACDGQKVIVDLHNFGRYYSSPLRVSDGPMLADVWQKLAAVLKGHPNLYGYELMNEPHDLPGDGPAWAKLAQSAINGIRRSDKQAFVIVPGYGWQTARFWPENNPTLHLVKDRNRRIRFAAHQYFDSDYSGSYQKPYSEDGATPTIGVDRVQPFLSWLTQHALYGMLTEYGVPGQPEWLTVLSRFLEALRAHPRIVGGCYWAAGPWWGDYPLSVEPPDKPQTAVL